MNAVAKMTAREIKEFAGMLMQALENKVRIAELEIKHKMKVFKKR